MGLHADEIAVDEETARRLISAQFPQWRGETVTAWRHSHADIPLGFRREVLAAYPRLTLAEEFGAGVRDQSERKPHSHARRLLDGGVVDRLARNPLERL